VENVIELGAAELVVADAVDELIGRNKLLAVARLTDVRGTLYGTTQSGGAGTGICGCGTVFKLNPKTTVYRVVYSFPMGGGEFPLGGLTNFIGTLYGTTQRGGTDGNGTVFSINPMTGAEAGLYSFQNNSSDGANPQAGLINVKGTLYGTTYAGGGTGCAFSQGCGTVFSINPTTGDEAVVHSFQNDGTDGFSPYAGLINVKGMLYGTTYDGGGTGCVNNLGCGTVFSINPTTGAEAVVHSFQGFPTDGNEPAAGLIEVKGTLYGTTSAGGANGYGTVFSINTATGVEKLVYSFQNDGADGYFPQAGLINVDGRFMDQPRMAAAPVVEELAAVPCFRSNHRAADVTGARVRRMARSIAAQRQETARKGDRTTGGRCRC
jgi:uncharacterized repeat protein (TIGR03803 family)